MKGLDEFIQLFGTITISEIVVVVLAGLFLYKVYQEVQKFFNNKIAEQNERAEAERVRDEQLKEALESVRKYPEYRQQSIEIQKLLESEMQELREENKNISERLKRMEEMDNKRTRNSRKDRLLQAYRYYTNPETNPTHSWTRMEADSFWDMFADYEEAGGNGYMHTVVQPAMESLNIIEI